MDMKAFFKGCRKTSYSQCGEDLIVAFIFDTLRIGRPSYLDIGANHPRRLNNTYAFYRRGGRGVCVEPDPSLHRLFRLLRPRDICLKVGVGITEESEADFFVMSNRTLNTFSREEAERYAGYGTYTIRKTLRIPVVPVNRIISEHFGCAPDFVSLDVEGLDFAIVESFDFGAWRPKVFCIETLTYAEDASERKLTEIIDVMTANGYLAYADTYINTIFVDRAAWEAR